MVPEPTNSAVQVFVSGLSATILSIVGVTFHGLLWALFGAIVALIFSAPAQRGKAVFSVMAAMLCGAVMADLVLAIAMGNVSDRTAGGLHLGAAFVIGGGAKPIFTACINAAVARINAAGGVKP
jgi:hypothetical protein